MMKKLYVCAAFLLAISGCNDRPTTNANKPSLSLATTPVSLDNVQFHVTSEDSVADVWKTLKDNKRPPVIFYLTPDEYQKLSTNYQKIQNHIVESETVIKQYKSYYEPK